MSEDRGRQREAGSEVRLNRRGALGALLSAGVMAVGGDYGRAASAPNRTAAKKVELRNDLGAAFREVGLRGSFTLYDVTADRLVLVNRQRAEQRFVPASTYKIPHSLIALETGVVKSPEEILPYGGKPARIKAWERDMSLREAIRISNVPIYQGIARRIGPERMHTWIERLGYGNRRLGKVIDQFWLVGPLEVSAVEQVRFLARLAKAQLPASRHNQEIVRDILRIEKTPAYELFAKTGWAADQDPQIGWWVGWVERAGRIYSFALNADLTSQADADKRIPLCRELLHQLKVL